MEKTLIIEGMNCSHCSARVEKALSAMKGIESASVDLDSKSAKVSMSKDISDKAFSKAIKEAGFTLKEVK